MKIRLLLSLSALLMVSKVTAQFSGVFAPANWTFSSTTVDGDGSVNTSGAPASIILSGSDNGPSGDAQYENWEIIVPSSGMISFNYKHVSPDVDEAFYVINGLPTLITSAGAGNESEIPVTAGQAFAFRVVNNDNCCGRGVLTITHFIFTPTGPLITTQPKNNAVCVNGSATFTIVALETTSYQWEVNTGSGYASIVDEGIYTGATTATLALSIIPDSMNGYLYRCIATGTLDPPAISTAAMLEISSMEADISAKTNIACNGDSTGAATVSVTGGTGTKTYSWAPSGGTAATASGLVAGTYTCTITDASTCAITKTVTITEPTMLAATETHTNVSCFGEENGMAIITATGGTGSYTYAWAPHGGTNASSSGLTTGTYTVTIQDSVGCTLTTTVSITEPTQLLVTGITTPIACFGDTSTVNIFASGGTPPYKGIGSFKSPAGLHIFNITDSNSCVGYIEIDIQEPIAIETSQSVAICKGEKLIIGDSTYTEAGTYVNLLQSNETGCDSTVTTYLTITKLDLAVIVTGDTLMVGTADAMYQWIDCASGSPIDGAASQTYAPWKSGNYSVIVVYEGCKDTSECTPFVLSGIAKQNALDQLNVYPNPSLGTFTIRTTLAGTYTIINELGQTVRGFELNSTNNYSTSIGDLSNGTYYVIGFNHNRLVRQKVVVIK